MARFGTKRYEADEFYKLALQAFAKGDVESALENMGYAVAVLPNHAEYYAARGLMHLDNGAKDRADINFDSALQCNPYELLGHYGKGVIAYQEKEWDDALEHFNQAWAIDPKRPEIHYYLGIIHHRKNDNPLALQWMLQAQQEFVTLGDKREKDATKWVKELGKIIKKSQSP